MRFIRLILASFCFLLMQGDSSFAQITSRNLVSYIGPYSSANTYAKGDVVTWANTVYLSIASSNLNNTPGSSPAYWTSFGAPGAPVFVSTAAPIYIFGDSITCGYWSSGPNGAGSPPFAIAGVYCYQDRGWPYIVRKITNVYTYDYAIPADEVGDIWVRQIMPQNVAPSLANPILSGVMIGTNNANHEGQGASVEADFINEHLAVETWLGIPAEYKTAPSACTLSGGFTLGSNALGAYFFSNTGGTATCAITTFGGPIFIWHSISNSAGTTNYTITPAGGGSAVATGSYSSAMVAGVTTQNGTNNTAGVARVPVPAGSYNVVLTNASGASVGMGVGTPAPTNTSLYQHPVVCNLDIPRVQIGSTLDTNGAFDPARIEYNKDILADVTMLQNDGIDARYVVSDNFVNGNATFYTDGVHPTPAGGLGYATAWLSCANPVPNVTKTTSFTSSNGLPYTGVTGGTTSGTAVSTVAGTLGASVPNASNAMIPLSGTGALASVTVQASGAGSFYLYLVTCSACTGTSAGTITINNTYTLTATASGTQTFYAGRDFTAPTIGANQFLALSCNTACIDYQSSGGPGYWYINSVAPATGQTWTYAGSEGYLLGIQANVGGTVITTGGTPTGITGGTTVGTSGITTTGQWSSPYQSNAAIPITATGTLQSITTNIKAVGGSFDILIMNCSGCSGSSGTITITNRFTLTPTTTGLQTFYAGRDFTAVSVTSGQLIGLAENGTYTGYSTSSGPGWYYINSVNPASGQTWAFSGSGYTVDLSANVGGTITSSPPTTATDTVSLPGMTSYGHCSPPSPTNASAASNVATTYISAKAAGSVSISHAPIAGMTFDLTCTPF